MRLRGKGSPSIGESACSFSRRSIVGPHVQPIFSGVPAGCGSPHHVPDLFRLRRTGDEPNPVSALLLLALAGTYIRFQADRVPVRSRWNRLLDASVLAYVLGVVDPSMAPCANGVVLVGRCSSELSTSCPCKYSLSVSVPTAQAGASIIFPSVLLPDGADQ